MKDRVDKSRGILTLFVERCLKSKEQMVDFHLNTKRREPRDGNYIVVFRKCHART
jgi:hypothetical protein